MQNLLPTSCCFEHTKFVPVFESCLLVWMQTAARAKYIQLGPWDAWYVHGGQLVFYF